MREFIVKDWKSSGPLRVMRDTQDGQQESDRVHPAVRTYEVPATAKESEPPKPATGPKASEPPAPPAPSAVPHPAGSAPSAAAKGETRKPSPPKKSGERFFIVRYAGAYVGFYEAEDELKPQEAFLCVARELSAQGNFDPEELSLYKPVLIKSARPPKGKSFVRGKLCKVTTPPQDVAETPAEAKEPEPSSPESHWEHADLPVVCLEEPA